MWYGRQNNMYKNKPTGAVMEVEKTQLEGVLLIKPPTVFEDFRGTYVEIYNEVLYKEVGIAGRFHPG